jgi:hypothetical protein
VRRSGLRQRSADGKNADGILHLDMKRDSARGTGVD